jgi:AraC-like DNA-binding protein
LRDRRCRTRRGVNGGDHLVARECPLRAATLARAQQHIEQNLWDPDLSPTDVARAVFVSPRHLHALFREQGTSVARYLMKRRLDHAHRDLADPRLARLSVADIAARLGFRRPSHFAHAFRTRFGLSPSEHRHSGQPAPRAPASGDTAARGTPAG